MLHLDSKNPQSFTSLLAFKPRQVLLAQPTKTTPASKITSEFKPNLHQIILDYLHRNGFSTTLKRFKSEAQIQTDARKASSLRLEDMFCKHTTSDADSKKGRSNKPVLGNDEAMAKEKACTTNEETTSKKKKKKVIKEQSEVTDKKMKESSKNLGRISKDIVVDELETQLKKKKRKHDSVSSTDDVVTGLKIDDLTKKNKDKKKKNIEKVKSEPPTTDRKELATDVTQKVKKKLNTDVDENETTQLDVANKEKKSSMKRKRSLSDENENVSTDMTISEESKSQKTKTSKEENSKKEEINAQEISNKQFDGETNGKLEIDVVKSKKKRNIKPKTVNAFQRVKVDKVEFAHDKLQDNSYWAKDGAEIGYGAKAQEVLGQVRGRDFRHEKTKKKRGSYRGGVIDQQSYSIKFNYSDED